MVGAKLALLTSTSTVSGKQLGKDPETSLRSFITTIDAEAEQVRAVYGAGAPFDCEQNIVSRQNKLDYKNVNFSDTSYLSICDDFYRGKT